MSIAEQEGVLDQVSDKGIILGGNRLSYSKWFEGDRPTDDDLGCKIRVLVDVGTKCSFMKRLIAKGERAVGWKPPEPSRGGFGGGGGGRRFSPEELELKKDEGTRIARSVAIDRAIQMVKEGISIEKVADLAMAVEAYLLKGDLPQTAKACLPEVPVEKGQDVPPSPARTLPEVTPAPEPPKKEAVPPARATPKRLTPQAVNALFNEAMRGGLVKDWQGYVAYVQGVLKVQGRTPYQMSPQDYVVVEARVRSRLGQSSAA